MTENGAQEPESGRSETVENGATSRERSTILFPYMNLDVVVPLPKAVYAWGARTCERGQLAGQLKMAPDGGQFRQKLQNARTYGLLSYSGPNVELTEIGVQLCDPATEKEALVKAFLSVPLFERVYEQLRDRPLPPDAAIQRQMIEMGVAPKQAQRARRAFKSSARTAGFFDIAADRLVRPHTSGSNGQLGNTDSGDETESRRRSGSGDDPPPRGPIHPLIEALLAEMPEAGARWEKDHCVTWLKMVLLSFGMIYENRTELQEIEIAVRDDSPI
ncbi:MAG: hypothetical protein OXQ29_00940 [Rhodospirillaceae bacterium]|nr:hypothetical protein [Rhodospirillaceae bacterium]